MATITRAHWRMLVLAEARWAGARTSVPVRGEAWFIGLKQQGEVEWCDGLDHALSELLAKAKAVYPTMFSAIERIEQGEDGPVLRLRPLEVFEDDIANAGLGELRLALARRAEVCGMRVVACLNGVLGRVAMHGLPLGRDPSVLPSPRIESMLDELELMGAVEEGRVEASKRL